MTSNAAQVFRPSWRQSAPVEFPPVVAGRFRHCPRRSTIFATSKWVGYFFSSTAAISRPMRIERTAARSVTFIPTPPHFCPAYSPLTGTKGWFAKCSPGQILFVQLRGHFLAIHPRRAKLLKRGFRSAAHGNSRILQNLQSRIQDGALQCPQIWRRRNPADAGAFKEIAAVPVLHANDVQFDVDVILRVEKLRQLADRQSVADRQAENTPQNWSSPDPASALQQSLR